MVTEPRQKLLVEDALKSTRRKKLRIVSKVSFANDADLVIIVDITVLAIIFIVTPYFRDSVIRSALGVLFVLFIPGYAIVSGLFPRKEALSTFERLALSFGLSIAAVPLIGLPLAYSPWGISLGLVVLSVGLLTVVGVLCAKLRRDALPFDERFALQWGQLRHATREVLPASAGRFDRLATIVLIISVLTTVTMFAYIAVAPKQGELYTEFYVLGADRSIENYPTEFTLGQAKQVIVGVTNHEQRDATYTLVVALNDSLTTHTLHSEQLSLANGQTWEKTIAVQPDIQGKNLKLSFLLYIDNNLSSPYRENHLWVNVTQ